MIGDILNEPPRNFTAVDVSTARDPNFKQTLRPQYRNYAEHLLGMYKTNPHFKVVADAARHYVHNNSGIVNGSRLAVGMEPRATSGWSDQGYRIGDTTLFDGVIDKRRIMPVKEAIEHAEALFETIRESKPNTTKLSRGMSFEDTSQGNANFSLFKSLRVGDDINLPLSSFASDKGVAVNFMNMDAFMDVGKNAERNNVMLEIDGEHHSVSMEAFNHTRELEHVTSGTFKVVGIIDETEPSINIYGEPFEQRFLKITIKQTGVF